MSGAAGRGGGEGYRVVALERVEGAGWARGEGVGLCSASLWPLWRTMGEVAERSRLAAEMVDWHPQLVPPDHVEPPHRESLTVQMQHRRMSGGQSVREARCAASREVLVGLACELRDRCFLASIFYAWVTYRWRREAMLAREELAKVREGELESRADQRPPLLVLTSLEHQRARLTQLLHESHVENRWLRQYFSGTAAHKQLLLLWAGDSRLLQRCWLAWGMHITRSRMAREQRNEVHQLAFALRVASISQAPGLALSADVPVAHPHHPEDPARFLFAGYIMRRAWIAWRAAVSLASIEAQYEERVEISLSAERERLQRLALCGETSAADDVSIASSSSHPNDGFSLLRIFSPSALSATSGYSQSPSISGVSVDSHTSPGILPFRLGAASSEEATRRQLARHQSTRALSIALLGWRIVTVGAKLKQMQDRDMGALVVSLWKASVSGVAQSSNTAPAPRVSRGLAMRGLLVEDSDSDGDFR